MLKKNIKKIFTFLFESKVSLKNLKNKYKGKRVLLLGDGISAAYATEIFKDYDAIIACNNSINNKYLENTNLLFHVIMEPDLLRPGKHDEVRKLWKNVHELFQNTKLIMNPLGRLFNFFIKYRNVIYLSPYHKIIKENKIIYNDFTAAFQATLGIALICGFDKIDCVGFDAWLLTPKNNLRWYSDTKDPISFDYNENMYIEEFILNASKLSKISVLTYAHYKSLYSFIDPIVIKSKFINYIPGTDRYTLMRDDFKNRIESIEKRYYPTGYIVNK